MVRQYIGARYVPKFYENSDGTAAWRAGVIYEPLTIVTYNGNSYTSKKPVPAEIGAPSANTDYWVATGVYNEQLNDLLNRVNAMEEYVDTAVESKLSKIGYQHAVLLTDSYGLDAVTGGESWLTKAAALLGDRVEHTQAWGGAAFGYPSTSQYYFANCFAELAVNEDVDVVIILCGANDGNLLSAGSATETTIQQGLNSAMTVLKTKYPNALIKLGFVGRNKNVNLFRHYATARGYYVTWASRRGYEYIENSEYCLHSLALIGDQDIHPNAAGSEELAYLAKTAVDARHYDAFFDYHLSPIARVEVRNGRTKFIYTSATGWTVTGAIGSITPINDMAPINFGEDGSVFNPVSDVIGPAACAVAVDGSRSTATASFVGVSGKMYVQFMQIGGELREKNVTALILPKTVTFECDTMYC